MLYDIITIENRGWEVYAVTHIKTLSGSNMKNNLENRGCGECQTSCQSACKTSCTVGNQTCENK